MMTYKDIYLVCTLDVSTSLYIKAIFVDSCVNYLIQNLHFEMRLAIWKSCYIRHIANIDSST